jgi:acyl-coenzyme A synthetase/AMP-(fatty) acid ligase
MSAGSRFLNRLRVVLDGTLTAANIIDKAVAAHPDRELLHGTLLLSPHTDLRSITVREIFDQVIHIGKCLGLAGMRRYDRVAIYKTNSPDYFIYTAAIIRSGGIAVPVNSGMAAGKLSQYLSYTGASIVITDKQHFDQQISGDSSFSQVDRWLFQEEISVMDTGHLPDKGPVVMAKDDVAIIVHTSGTTGFPKGVICRSGSLIQGIKRHYMGEPISVKNRVAIAGHFNHLVCLLGIFSALLGNIPTYGYSRHEASFLLRQISIDKITIFFAFPDIYLDMYLHGLENYDLSSIKVWIGTADASHEVHKEVFCRKGASLNIFGRRLSTCIFIEPLGASEVGFAALQHYYRTGSKRSLRRAIGRPLLHGPRVKVADENGKRVKTGTVGRLMVKGKTVFPGYWNAHDLLPGAMKDGWWFTGDMVYKDGLGRYYHLDRLSDVVCTTRGNVYSLLAEERLLTHERIGEVAVIGLAHPVKGMVPVAIVQEKSAIVPENNTSLQTAILEWAHRELPLITPIEAVIAVHKKDIPRGLTGKVLKRELREYYAAWFSAPDRV